MNGFISKRDHSLQRVSASLFKEMLLLSDDYDDDLAFYISFKII